ncbi:MAG TPA: TonB-dependent receptor, partial [Chromatiales bacterium]|nr:TonB-dependent receptor [Chromatiales bacterium]
MSNKLFALAMLTLPMQAAVAAEQLETIEVKDLRQKLQQAGMLKDEIQQTEVISTKDIERKQAANVTEAIQNEPGVNVSTECSMCGVKRVMINGLKGEHTTVLVDGVPTHSMISGFYGLDGVSSAGVERVEIARGAGASLIAPEAVGGSVNIVTKRATKNAAEIDLSAGENGYR